MSTNNTHFINTYFIFQMSIIYTHLYYLLEKEVAAHSSVLAWRIPGTGELGGLPSMGSHRVRHDGSDLACMHAYYL